VAAFLSTSLDLIVIGAGAAGQMCASEAGRRGRRVLLLDHWSKIGERIRISGGGRCNFTNRQVGAEHYLSENPHFCRSALARYTPSDLVALVDRHAVAYEERDHGQLFCTGSAQDIIDMLREECARAGVGVVHPCRVGRVDPSDGREAADGVRFSIATDQGTFLARSLVVATGGLAAPKLGASGLGYEIARRFGLPVIEPRPALVPLALPDDTLAAMQPLAGVSVDSSVRCAADPSVRFRGNTLVTHRGLSGPAILQVSSYWQRQACRGRTGPLEIDLLPGVDASAWLADRRQSRMLLPNLLAERMSRRFAHEWCAMSRWTKPAGDLSALEFNDIARSLNAWRLMPSGTLGFDKAEVTLGGVDTRALSSKTMEAREVPGLYFVGEVVDVTGWLGGYNFQWAWSSGWVAGQFA
jgi:predicted Rossmann fold flavoprotein